MGREGGGVGGKGAIAHVLSNVGEDTLFSPHFVQKML